MELIDYEKYIIKQLFTNPDARDKLYSFLDPKYFDDEFAHNDIIKNYIKFKQEYGTYPTPKELVTLINKEETFNALKSILKYDLDGINDKFLQEQAAEFFRQKMIMNHVYSSIEAVKDKGTAGLTGLPDSFREALSFSFDTHVGLDLFEDGDRLYKSMHHTDKVIQSGLSDLDKLIKGGFHEKTLTLLIAETNMGKSLIKCSFATNALLQNKNVLYVTLEMSEEKISERIMANLFDIAIDELILLPEDRFNRLLQKQKEKLKSKLIIKEFPTRGANTNSIRNLLKELELKKNFKPDIIYIDYLGIMTTNSKFVDGNTNIMYKVISEELRGLAVETGLPIVSANQTNRGGMGVSEIDLTDVADSIGQTMTADIIIGVTQTEEMNEQNIYAFKLLKNRYGSKFNRVSIGVDYPKQRLYDLIDEDKISDVNDADIEKAKEVIRGTIKKNNKAKVEKSFDFE